MKEDNELIDLFLNRSDKAILHTSDKYNNYCYSIAYGILKNHEDSEECVNDTYMSAWNSIPPNIPKKLSCFLGRITRNAALNIYEKRHAAKRGRGQEGTYDNIIEIQKYDVQKNETTALCEPGGYYDRLDGDILKVNDTTYVLPISAFSSSLDKFYIMNLEAE